jgi:para-aminobenzoate synthetase
MRSLIVDNYDSFTYNLYQLLAEINGDLPTVITNDQLSWKEIKDANFDNIIISPGPGSPATAEDFGICRDILIYGQIPVLGVCLGHQGLGYYHKANLSFAPEPMHGRISKIYHRGDLLFQNIPSQFTVVRYHSLLLSSPLSPQLEEIAWTKNDHLIMAIKHKYKPFWGVQFHPESIGTDYGKQILINFTYLTQQFWRRNNKQVKNNYQWQSLGNITNKPQVSLITQTGKKDKSKITKSGYQVYGKKIDFWLESETVFQSLFAQSDYSFWLDSSMVAEGLSRFSFMGDNQGKHSFIVSYQVDNQEIKIIKDKKVSLLQDNLFDFLDQKLIQYYCESKELPFKFNGGFVGYFGYELKALVGGSNQHKSNLPDAEFIFADRVIVFDHLEKKIYLVCLDAQNTQNDALIWLRESEDKLQKIKNNYQQNHNQDKNFNINQTFDIKLTRNKQDYLTNINTCLQKIKEGESYEVCLTNQINLPSIINPLVYYCLLRQENPAPYSAYLKLGKKSIICSSPERFLSLDRDGWLESKPIKGTCKKSPNQQEDLQLQTSLKYSEKEQAENLMIVDLLRNDLGRVCEIGTIHVPKLMAIETYSTLHQMVSTIRGKIRQEIKAVDCIKASFPGGSMTGAPKKRTMEIIDQLETEARGVYSGSIGFLAVNGTLDLNIVIRTAVVTPEKTTIGVGGAITALSHPESEFAEIILKAQALIDVIKKNVHTIQID